MQVADRFGMEWQLFYDNKVKRVALLVSRMDHCLYDLLIRHRAGVCFCSSRACVMRRAAPPLTCSDYDGAGFSAIPWPSVVPLHTCSQLAETGKSEALGGRMTSTTCMQASCGARYPS